jgi:hypothetical protein
MLETISGLPPEEIIRSNWWQELRKAMWILKIGNN